MATERNYLSHLDFSTVSFGFDTYLQKAMHHESVGIFVRWQAEGVW